MPDSPDFSTAAQRANAEANEQLASLRSADCSDGFALGMALAQTRMHLRDGMVHNAFPEQFSAPADDVALRSEMIRCADANHANNDIHGYRYQQLKDIQAIADCYDIELSALHALSPSALRSTILIVRQLETIAARLNVLPGTCSPALYAVVHNHMDMIFSMQMSRHDIAEWLYDAMGNTNGVLVPEVLESRIAPPTSFDDLEHSVATLDTTTWEYMLQEMMESICRESAERLRVALSQDDMIGLMVVVEEYSKLLSLTLADDILDEGAASAFIQDIAREALRPDIFGEGGWGGSDGSDEPDDEPDDDNDSGGHAAAIPIHEFLHRHTRVPVTSVA